MRACRASVEPTILSAVIRRLVLVACLAVGLVPGFGELIEDGAHLVLEGRTDHDEGEVPCPEHGCAPTSHHCSCCASASIEAYAPEVRVAHTPFVGVRRVGASERGDRPGFRSPPLRPPTA